MTHPTQTARADLLNLMAEWGLTTGRGSREIADRILNAHAHELAQDLDRMPSDCCDCGGCFSRAADLIDPQAQR